MQKISKLLYLLVFIHFSLYGAMDGDFDGVDDSEDRCQNTPFSDLIDASGCSVATLSSPMAYDFIVGYNYATSNTNTLENRTTTSTTLQADIYKDDLSFQLLSSYYKSDGSSDEGWNDTQLSLFYAMHPSTLLKIQAGVALILPTYSTGYKNEAMDYVTSLAFEYLLQQEIKFFAGYSFAKINDEDVGKKIEYQDTNSFYAGLLYMHPQNGTFQFSYSNAQSIYVGVEPIETVACGVVWSLDAHWFTLFDYRYGVSESASEHEVAVRLGYTF